jgi:hypothetical protein
MTQYPVVIRVVGEGDGMQVKATTSVELALKGGKSLEAELSCIEIDYQAMLAAVRAALVSAGKGKSRDPRAYWFAGKYLAEFMERLEAHGFYLVGKNTTPAAHLGMSASSVKRMIAFHGRYRDPFSIDPTVPLTAYREHREPRARK